MPESNSKGKCGKKSGQNSDYYSYIKEDWLEYMMETDVNECDIQNVIMNFFTTKTMHESLEMFSEETWIKPRIPIDNVRNLDNINKKIKALEIDQAIRAISDFDSDILKAHPKIGFMLKQHKLLKLIEKGSLENAINFAKVELAPSVRQDLSLLLRLEETMSLIAFDDLKSKSAQRIIKKINDPDGIVLQVSEAIFNRCNVEIDCLLEFIVKNALFSQKELLKISSSFDTPVMDDIAFSGIRLRRGKMKQKRLQVGKEKDLDKVAANLLIQSLLHNEGDESNDSSNHDVCEIAS